MVTERRRHLRHKVHSPAYASIGAGVGGVVLDANERGVAIESVARLAPQSLVDVRLDLLDTRGTAVTPARVTWCDSAGRAGLEFLNLTGESRRQLQQWLLLNALLGTESAARVARPSPASAEAAGDPAFLLFVEQALACTAAHGAALAVVDGATVVCRATAGEIAPPLGSKLDTDSGISGACLRSGRWLRCDDPSLDPHVDRESCRALGINSVLAVPIGERGDMVGLIEVFSRELYAFKPAHCAALQEVAKAVARTLRPEISPAPLPVAAPVMRQEPAQPPASEPQPTILPSPAQNAAAPAPAAAAPQNAVVPPLPAAPQNAVAPAPAPMATAPVRPTQASGRGERLILLALIAVLAIVGLWFVLAREAGDGKDVAAAAMPAAQSSAAPADASRNSLPASASPATEPVAPASVSALSDSLRQLRRRAEAGDAEAQFELGARYASGEEVAQDYAQAVKWFTRAADGGQVLAAATLGAYYWAGRGVPKDDVTAYMWSAVAQQGGDEASKYRLAILRARMSVAEITEAEQRAAAWRQTHVHQSLARSAAQ